jgi:hypothetical protein
VPGALHALASAAPSGCCLAFRIRDDLLPENSVPVTLDTTGDFPLVRDARPSDPWLEADIRTFSQLLCGYLSATDGSSMDACRFASDAAYESADRLFPPGEPFISELDRF